MASVPGARLIVANRYEVDLDHPLGSGGMAVVYSGRDLRSRRQVAVKTLRPEYQRLPGLRQRFRHEARMMAICTHPNLATIYDLHEDERGSWAIMEFVPGENLKQLVEREGPLHPEEVASILDQVSAGLKEIHAKRLVHLDIKPQNILREPDGRVKLIDFGLAQPAGETQQMDDGRAFGTVAYLAPEQASGEKVTAASDVYALGCVAYELLTGAPPFQAPDGPEQKNQLIRAHLNQTPVPPTQVRPELHIPAWVDDVLDWALAKRPEDRFHDVQTFARMFRSGTEGEATPAPDATQPLTSANGHGPRRWFPSRRQAPVPTLVKAAPAAAIPTMEPSTPSKGRRLYQLGGRAARRGRRFRRLLWRLTLVLAIGNLILGMALLVRGGPALLVSRALSVAPGTTTTVAVDNLNLRIAPGSAAEIITVLRSGDEVRVTGLSQEADGNRWWPVETRQNDVVLSGFVWDGGLAPNQWTGRMSWAQRAVDRVQDARHRIGDGIAWMRNLF
jgi:serine/threonine-protein kinase